MFRSLLSTICHFPLTHQRTPLSRTGVIENTEEEFEAKKAHDKHSYHTPQHSQSKLTSSLKGSLSAQAASHPSSRHAEPKQLLFASQSERDLQDNGPLSLSSSSH